MLRFDFKKKEGRYVLFHRFGRDGLKSVQVKRVKYFLLEISIAGHVLLNDVSKSCGNNLQHRYLLMTEITAVYRNRKIFSVNKRLQQFFYPKQTGAAR